MYTNTFTWMKTYTHTYTYTYIQVLSHLYTHVQTIDIKKVDKQLTHAMHVKIDTRMTLLSIN